MLGLNIGRVSTDRHCPDFGHSHASCDSVRALPAPPVLFCQVAFQATSHQGSASHAPSPRVSLVKTVRMEGPQLKPTNPSERATRESEAWRHCTLSLTSHSSSSSSPPRHPQECPINPAKIMMPQTTGRFGCSNSVLGNPRIQQQRCCSGGSYNLGEGLRGWPRSLKRLLKMIRHFQGLRALPLCRCRTKRDWQH